MALPGIGKKAAEAILLLREQLGGRFRYAEELLQAPGIGAGKLNAIYDLVYVSREE